MENVTLNWPQRLWKRLVNPRLGPDSLVLPDSRPAMPPVGDPQPIANGKKVLVVDDNKVILKTLSLKLSANGYAIVTAEDGAAAVRAVRSEKPDLILLDVSFPPDVAHGGGVPW